MSNISPFKERIIFIDYAKAVGIFLVVLGHSIALQDNVSEPYNKLCEIIYSFHMPLFFVINGFVLSYQHKVKTVAQFCKMYIVPYSIVSVVYIFLKIIDGTPKRVILANAFATICGRGMAPVWFLAALFVANVLLFDIIKISKMNIKIIMCLTLFFAIITVVTYPIFTKYGIHFGRAVEYVFTAVFRMMPSCFFILFGFLLGKAYCDERRYLGKKFTRISFSIIGIIILTSIQIITDNVVNMHVYLLGNPCVFLITGCLGSLIILVVCEMLPANMTLISNVGKSTLHIMWMHYPPMPILMGVISLFSYMKIRNGYVAITLVSIAFCYLLLYIVKRVLRLF